MILLLLSLFAPSAGFAADRVVFVSQKLGTMEYNAGEAARAIEYPKMFAGVFQNQPSGGFKTTHVTVSQIEDLPAAVQAAVPAGDRIVSVVFLGHGSPKSYSLSAGR